MFRSVVVLDAAIPVINGVAAKGARDAGKRNAPLILREGNVDQMPGIIAGKVDDFLVRLPCLSSLRQKTAEMQQDILVGTSGLRVIVVQHAKLGACCCPVL